MRRAAPTGPLSPKLLKHFAAVTVGLTALLAVFASGEDWGAHAQIGAVEAKNNLLTTEAERLGARRVAARINIREGARRPEFGDETGYDFGERGGDSAPPTKPQQPAQSVANFGAAPTGLAGPSGGIKVINGVPSMANAAQLKIAKTRGQSVPTAQEMEQITASSARRSGQPATPD